MLDLDLIPLRSRSRGRLAGDLVKSTETVLYEVPSDSSAQIFAIWVCSVHSGSSALSLNHVRAGQSLSNANALFFELSVSSKTTTIYDGIILMGAGDRIIIKGDANDRICVTLYGDQR
jgi:hypothetical protein